MKVFVDEVIMGQGILNFDLPAARAARAEAIERVETHADKRWLAEMFEVVREVARTHKDFTTDVPIEIYYGDPTRPQTHEPRAMGAVMTRAAREGLVRATDRMRNSVRRSCHNRKIQVWESLVYEGGGSVAAYKEIKKEVI